MSYPACRIDRRERRNERLTSLPMRLTPAMQATAIKAISNAYSDIVAAPSSFQSSFTRLIVVSSLHRQPSQAARDEFVEWKCKLDAR